MFKSFRPVALFAVAAAWAGILPASAKEPIAPVIDPPGVELELVDPAAFGFGRPSFILDASWVDTQEFANRAGGVDVFELRAVAPVWGRRSGDFGFAFSIGYSLTEVDFNQFFLGEETLHSLQAQISLLWKPDHSAWWAALFLTPGLGTDFQGISWDDFKIAGVALAGYRFRDNFTLAGGLFARYAIGDGIVVPALGLIWQPGPFIVQLTPPFAVLGWRTTDQLTLSLSAYPAGGQWDVEDPAVSRIDLDGWQAAASVIYKVTDRLSVSVRGGINFAGELEFRDSADRVLANETLDPAPFGAVNVRVGF